MISQQVRNEWIHRRQCEKKATGSTQWQFATYLNPNEPQQQSERTQHHHLQGAGLSLQSNWQAGEAQRKTDIDLVSVLTQHWDSWSSHPHFIRAKTENSEAIQMALNWSFFFFFWQTHSNSIFCRGSCTTQFIIPVSPLILELLQWKL